MGNASEHGNKRKYLTKEEIFSIKGIENVNSIFNRFKNSKGIISLIDFKHLTRGLLNDSICKKIIKICGSGDNKMTNYDLMYFLAILNTNSFDAKLNFILDFIFTRKNTLDIKKYKKKVNKYYNKSPVLLNILLNNELLSSKEQIGKEEIFNYIKNTSGKAINNFKFYTNTFNINSIENKDEFKFCECLKEKNEEKEAENIYFPNINIPKINYLEMQFKMIEKNNDNIFTIDLFESM